MIFKKFFKDKRGVSKFLEMLLIFPLLLYIFFYSYYELLAFTVNGAMQDSVNVLTREIISEKSLDNALHKTAKMVANERINKNYQINRMVIYSTKNSNVSYIIDFGDNFNRYVDLSSKTFNITNYREDNNIPLSTWNTYNENWKIGNDIELVIKNDLRNNVMKNMMTFRIWDFEKKEFVNLTFNINTIAISNSRRVISNENTGR